MSVSKATAVIYSADLVIGLGARATEEGNDAPASSALSCAEVLADALSGESASEPPSHNSLAALSRCRVLCAAPQFAQLVQLVQRIAGGRGEKVQTAARQRQTADRRAIADPTRPAARAPQCGCVSSAHDFFS